MKNAELQCAERDQSTMNQRALNENTELQGAEKDPRAMNQRALNRQKNKHKILNRRERSKGDESKSTKPAEE
jgi:hypothetical protein